MCIFFGFLAFKFLLALFFQRQPAEVKPQMMIGFSNSARSTLEEAEFFVPDSKDSSVIHMDLDRSFLTVPSSVNASIFESFLRQNLTDSETDVHSSIEKLVRDTYGFPGDDCPDIAKVSYRKEIMCGSTCLALFNKLVLCCMQEQGTFLFPFGTNGHYVKLAKFLNAKTLTIPTNVDSGFKIEPMALDAALEDAYENKNVTRAWVYISGPTINPSGFLYSDGEIKDLLSVCAQHAARVVIDISFSGREFQTDGWSRWNLSNLSYDICLCPPLSYFMLGELSLELTTGGLEFGFLISSKPSDVEVSFRNLSQPHSTLKYTFGKLLGLSQPYRISTLHYNLRELLGRKNEWDGPFPNPIMEQKEKLKSRANKLTKVSTL
jgi:methionine S-methyltransferase